MNERYQQIDDFLKFLSSIAVSNPDFKITHGTIYGELTRINVEEYDRYYNISDDFSYWINKFKERENINVFNSEKWKYFCQFTNPINAPYRSEIKMYIPLKPSGIIHGTEILFDYLEKNNIYHQSKVGTNVRNDDVVVRVYTKEDALKIARFVNENEYIKSNLIKPNPFMLNDGNIGYATDANLSYSSQIADYINSYLSELSAKKEIANANVNGLISHIIEVYNNVFVNGVPSEMEKFENYHEMGQYPSREKISRMANAAEVAKLIIYSLNGENNLNRVMQVYDELLDPNFMEQIEQHISDNYNKKNTEIIQNVQVNEQVNEAEILKQAILTTYEAYGYEHTKKALSMYALDGNTAGITRQNNARASVEKYLTSAKARQIIDVTCGNVNFDLYLNNILSRQALEYKESALENACLETLIKYGVPQTEGAIKNAINGNFTGFTNNNNARNILIANVDSREIEALIKDILIKNGIDNDLDLQKQFSNLMQYKLQEYRASLENNIKL